METKSPLKSKTVWLGMLTALIAALQYATGALDGLLSSGQMTILVGAVGLLSVVLRFLTGVPVSVKKVPPAGPVALLLVAVLASSGCAMSTGQRISLAGDSAFNLKEVAAPAWSSVCKLKAEKCVSDGVTASKDCAPWVDCQAGLKRFYEAHMAVQTALQSAAWWVLNGDESKATKILQTAMDSLALASYLPTYPGIGFQISDSLILFFAGIVAPY